ncbi:MAG: IPT/TIG domain-containing protein, partial [Blastocatellia bacterium]
MWKNSKNIYNFLKVTLLFLAVLLCYQIFTNKKIEDKKTLEVISSQTEIDKKDLKQSVNILNKFSEINEIEEKAPLLIGRNLFQDTSTQNVLPVADKFENKTNFITVTEILPSKIYQQNKPINILLKGLNFTNKAQVYVQNQLAKFNFISTTELEIALPIELVSRAGKLLIEVKEKNISSNAMYLEIEKSSIPDFVFVGTISDENTNKIILTFGKNQIITSVGETIKEKWQLVSLEGDFLIVEDLELNLKHRLQKGKQPKLPSVEKQLIAETQKKIEEKANNKIEANLF